MFKTARNTTGLSREEAAHRLYIGTRTLADYESGRTIAPPDAVMRMAEVYREPALPADYCSIVCPIGQVLAHSLDRPAFAVTVLRVLRELSDVEQLRDKLVRIAADGELKRNEVDEADRRAKVLRPAAGYKHQRDHAPGGVVKGERQMIPEALHRDDFIANLKEAHTRLLILKEDIKYPLSAERQKWLDGATLIVGHLFDLELADDIEAVLRKLGEP